MTTLLTRVWRKIRRTPDLSHVNFTVYVRESCCCCHTAVEILENYQKWYRFSIETVDVDSDSALAAEHGLSVPVIAMNGKVRFRSVVNPVLLERLLVAEGQNS